MRNSLSSKIRECCRVTLMSAALDLLMVCWHSICCFYRGKADNWKKSFIFVYFLKYNHLFLKNTISKKVDFFSPPWKCATSMSKTYNFIQKMYGCISTLIISRNSPPQPQWLPSLLTLKKQTNMEWALQMPLKSSITN